MDVFLHESAEKFLNKLDKKIQANLKAHLKELSEDPYSKHLDVKKLKGLRNKQDILRLRIGEYRIIYFIQENKIWVTEISRRESAYDF